MERCVLKNIIKNSEAQPSLFKLCRHSELVLKKKTYLTKQAQ